MKKTDVGMFMEAVVDMVIAAGRVKEAMKMVSLNTDHTFARDDDGNILGSNIVATLTRLTQADDFGRSLPPVPEFFPITEEELAILAQGLEPSH